MQGAKDTHSAGSFLPRGFFKPYFPSIFLMDISVPFMISTRHLRHHILCLQTTSMVKEAHTPYSVHHWLSTGGFPSESHPMRWGVGNKEGFPTPFGEWHTLPQAKD